MDQKYSRYFLQDDHLYRSGFNNPHLKYLALEEGEHLLQEMHIGCCGVDTGARDLVRKSIQVGF